MITIFIEVLIAVATILSIVAFIKREYGTAALCIIADIFFLSAFLSL